MSEKDKGGATNIRESLLNQNDRAAITISWMFDAPLLPGLVEKIKLENERLEKLKKLDKPLASSTPSQ